MTRKLGFALLLVPFLVAAKGQGCGSGVAGQTAPDMSGDWALEYDDTIDVEIAIGGAVYHESIGVQGGIITIDHDGQPISFNLDCARPEIVCPSEVWPQSVALDQRDEGFPRNVYVNIPVSECEGTLVPADPAECGAGTNNPDCDDVCDGTVSVSTEERFGLLNNANDELTVLLGGGIATNGINCALLSVSIAHTDVETAGSGETGNWEGVAMPDGEVMTGFAGGCLWAGDPDDDGTIEALVIGAAVKLSTGFSGTKQ